MILPDYSEYLKKPGMLEYIEQEWLDNPAFHDIYSDVINRAIKEYKIKSVIEIGCGTGNVAARLIKCNYTGLDANESCIQLAESKNTTKSFTCADIRSYTTTKSDLVFCFGVLKHFGLHEWDSIFKRISSLGEYFIFDMPICDEVKDDGEDHHHVWATMDWVSEKCKEVGLSITETNMLNKDEYCFINKRIAQ